jgi:hypothetical protein
MKSDLTQGLSFYLCFGKYAGFGIQGKIQELAFRIVLGWVSFGCFPIDIEVTLMKLIGRLETEK